MYPLLPLLGQRPSLDAAERLPLSGGNDAGPLPGDHHVDRHLLVAKESPGPPEPAGPYQRLADAILSYQVFPPWLLAPVLRRLPVQPGDTFGNCLHVFPGLDVFFAGRVSGVFSGPGGKGYQASFSLRTVAGHPMIGEETFQVEKDAVSGEVWVNVRSWSRPGNWLIRLGTPGLRWFQGLAVRAVLRHLQRIAMMGHTIDQRPRSRGSDATDGVRLLFFGRDRVEF
jgi:hypothetical protein